MDHTELAYLAGLFDGEGCIMIIKRKGYSHNHKVNPSPRYSLKIQLTNTNKEVIDWISSFGWYVRENTNLKKQWKRCWVVFLHDIRAKEWLEKLLPVLRIKKDEAKLAINFQEYKTKFTNGHGRQGLSQEMIIHMEEMKSQLSELKNQKL